MSSPDLQRLKVLAAIGNHPNQTVEQLATHTGLDQADVQNATRWLQFRYLIGVTRRPNHLATHHLTPAGRATVEMLVAARESGATAILRAFKASSDFDHAMASVKAAVETPPEEMRKGFKDLASKVGDRG